jgi:hypothetical protein
MKNKFKFTFAILFLAVLLSTNVFGEMTLWSSVSIDTNANSVNHHSYYQYYDDIEELSRGGQLIVDLKRSLYAGRTNDVIVRAIIEPMPYNLTNYTIDYCEFNATHTMTDYDNDGNLIGVNETTYGYTYSSTPANTTEILFKMKNRDSLVVDTRCYYNNSNYLYDENILFARNGIYLPANKCNDCEEFSLEELSNEIERTEQKTEKEIAIYNNVQSIISFNFSIWLFVSWIIKIGLLLLGISLIFMAIYYLYQFVKDIEARI